MYSVDKNCRDIVLANPFRCRVWQGHDRLEEHVNEDSCKNEIQSFLEHGQLVPVLGRRLHNDPDHDIELIYGARRLFVARHVNKPLMVEIKELSDREAIVAMDLENRQRKDVSAYERGRSFASWLRSGHFTSQDDIARALRISASQVSRLLKIARLPSVVISAFGSAVDICEGWGRDLSEAMEDPEKRNRILRAAREIGSADTRPSAREVYRQLLSAAAPGRTPKATSHDRVVLDGDGAPIFRVRQQRRFIAVLLPVDRVSRQSLSDIEAAIASVMETHVPRRAAIPETRHATVRDATCEMS